MITTNWSKAAAIFDAVVDLSESDRRAYLTSACADNPSLRNDVEAMLLADAEASGILSGPILGRPIPIGTEFEPSDRLGPYEIVRLIGRGGMGAVYLARRVEDFQRTVAVKVIDGLVPDRAAFRRFLRERQILSSLVHPNIARLYDGGVTDSGMPYLVMEYVEGMRLDEYCTSRGLSLKERLRLFRDVCRAVSYAHRHLIVHRDLKPGNIFVTEEGQVKLLDFGIARNLDSETQHDIGGTRSRSIVFTPGFASPEHVAGRQVTTLSDVYSLGVVLKRLVDEEHTPYGGVDQAPELGNRRLVLGWRSLRSSSWRQLLRGYDVRHIHDRATSVNPDLRHASVDDLARDVENVLTGVPPEFLRERLGYRLVHHVVENSVSVLLRVAVVIALVLSVWIGLSEHRRAIEMDAASASLAGYLSEVFAISDPEERVDSLITARQFLDVGFMHARALLDQNSEPYFRVASQLGRLYLKVGEAQLAEKVFRELIDHSAEGSRRAMSLFGYGMALHELGQHDSASDYYQSALVLALSAQPKDEGILSEIQERMILLYVDLNQLAKADSLADSCLLAISDGGEAGEIEMARLMVLKAQIKTRYGDLAAAEELYDHALRIQRNRLGQNSLQVAISMNNLGLIYGKTRRHELAANTLSRALDIKRKILGSSHPSVGMTLMNLAEARRHTAGIDSAVATLRVATELFVNKLGSRSVKAAQARNNLAVLVEENGDTEEAETLYRAALSTWEESLPPNHPTLVRGWHNLAMLLRTLGRTSESLNYYSRAAVGYRSHGSRYRRDLGEVLIGQAKVQRVIGDLSGAVASFRESLQIRMEELPAGHWRIGTAMSLLGETLALLGEDEEAETMLRQGLDILVVARGPDDPKTVEARARLDGFRPQQVATAG